MDIVLLVLLIIVIILLGVNIFINIKNKPSNSLNENDIKVIEQTVKNTLNLNFDRINDKLDSQVKLLKEANYSLFEKLEVKFNNLEIEIESLKLSFKDTNEMINDKLKEMIKDNNESVNQIKEKLSLEIKEFNRSVKEVLKEFNESINKSFDKLEENVKENLKVIRESNESKLDEITKVVNEKLENTLNERLKQSFNSVIEQIGGVNKAIGEIKGLASDVGSLKSVLTNVKRNGTMGEVILSTIIKDMLAPSQYEENVVTKKGSTERVEFAVKLPNQDDSYIYLPIDSKLPLEAYHKIQDAQNNSDVELLKAARTELKNQIKKYASDISSKYIDVPNTTEFAIMFLPIEGLNMEVLELGLFEELKTKYNVNIAGPTTFTAILNALQMGFKTLAIQKKSSDVFTLLAAVKTEFETFAGVLTKALKKVNEASDELDKLVGVRTRQIQKHLKNIETLDQDLTNKNLEIED